MIETRKTHNLSEIENYQKNQDQHKNDTDSILERLKQIFHINQ